MRKKFSKTKKELEKEGGWEEGIETEDPDEKLECGICGDKCSQCGKYYRK